MSRWTLIFATAAVTTGCGADAIEGTQAIFEPGGSFFDAPFPNPLRRRGDGTLMVADFPNPGQNRLLEDILIALETSTVGFGTTAGIFFSFDAPIDPATLPAGAAASIESDSSLFLVDVDESSPTVDQRIPVWHEFKLEPETYSPGNLLTVIPRPGVAMRGGTWHAAVILDGIRDHNGASLGSPLVLEQLKAGEEPEGFGGLVSPFARLWAHLDRAGISRQRVRAATVFRTGDPFFETQQIADWARAIPRPMPSGFVQIRDHDTFCVVEGNVEVPLVQNGERPYNRGGGKILVGAFSGVPLTQSQESIRFAVSIPKGPMPAGGWPLLFYAAGQGGAYTQFVDRGTFDEQQNTPGRGPAYYLAASGISALSIEAPLVGPRHPGGSTTGLDFFNVANPVAFRDNVRQGALDFVVMVRVAEALALPSALCPGASAPATFQFDGDRFYFHGHSTGASIGAVLLGVEPKLRAAVVSGAGGSWLYNLAIKKEPLDFGALVALLLGFGANEETDIFDAPLSLAQTLWESTEPINWAAQWSREAVVPKDVLIIEGVVDGFFPPPSANALAIASGALPVQPLVEETILDALAPFDRTSVTPPISGNLRAATVALVQHAQPPGIDGHYVAFELPGPKYQYRCFFESRSLGAAVVTAPNGDPLAPCP